MELPRKELTFPIQVIGTTTHQISETRGILTPDLLCTSPVRSVFLEQACFPKSLRVPQFQSVPFLGLLATTP